MNPELDLLSILAANLGDWERLRIAVENRIRSLKQRLDNPLALQYHPAYEELVEELASIKDNENEATKVLEKAVRDTIYGPWIKETHGLGYKSMARLLGEIGDPGWNAYEDRPRRGPAELWAYMGMHVEDGEAPRRQRGVRSNWSHWGRVRLWVVSKSAVDSGGSVEGPDGKYHDIGYRKVYSDTRLKYENAVHTQSCVRCGPAGHPAPAGSPLNDGHKYGRALRAVGKAILVDMYRIANDQDPKYSY